MPVILVRCWLLLIMWWSSTHFRSTVQLSFNIILRQGTYTLWAVYISLYEHNIGWHFSFRVWCDLNSSCLWLSDFTQFKTHLGSDNCIPQSSSWYDYVKWTKLDSFLIRSSIRWLCSDCLLPYFNPTLSNVSSNRYTFYIQKVWI
jgi:hypothetical protein